MMSTGRNVLEIIKANGVILLKGFLQELPNTSESVESYYTFYYVNGYISFPLTGRIERPGRHKGQGSYPVPRISPEISIFLGICPIVLHFLLMPIDITLHKLSTDMYVGSEELEDLEDLKARGVILFQKFLQKFLYTSESVQLAYTFF